MSTEASFPRSAAECGTIAVEVVPGVDPEPPETSVMEDRSSERRAESSKSPATRIAFSISSILQDGGNSVLDVQEGGGNRSGTAADVQGPSENWNESTRPTFFYRDRFLGDSKSQTSSTEAGQTADAMISSWSMSQTSPFIYREYSQGLFDQTNLDSDSVITGPNLAGGSLGPGSLGVTKL